MTFLDSLRSRESYLDRIPKDSVGSLAQEKAALSNFDQFCEYKFKVSSNNILRELRKINGTKQESFIFEMLQNLQISW